MPDTPWPRTWKNTSKENDVGAQPPLALNPIRSSRGTPLKRANASDSLATKQSSNTDDPPMRSDASQTTSTDTESTKVQYGSNVRKVLAWHVETAGKLMKKAGIIDGYMSDGETRKAEGVDLEALRKVSIPRRANSFATFSKSFQYLAKSIWNSGHSLETPLEMDKLKIFVGTWNMYGKSLLCPTLKLLNPAFPATQLPPDDLSPFIDSLPPVPESNTYTGPHLPRTLRHPFHLLVIGTQECEREIGEAIFFPAKDAWEAQLKRYLGKQYKLVATETLAALHLAVFVWQPVSHYVKKVETESIKTGFANMIGNKGAVAISLLFGTRSLLFINSHLTANQNKINERNQSVARISRELKMKGFHHNSPAQERKHKQGMCVLVKSYLQMEVGNHTGMTTSSGLVT
ncbi:Endonuclease/exonuclease/phosphatase [Jimgerdemannia flammicorona]|uniref:Endonuclease/exonuclease/phosphatase n=1 Tax=Jimgerdemannia flammicorona TaxID=994334 RepID=A0A433PV22_9FUNG|nr:Endonuclease/exonuclease/phosphatase [Jimgerdemannia flammicorona]